MKNRVYLQAMIYLALLFELSFCANIYEIAAL